jgi:DNA repair photolyase
MAKRFGRITSDDQWATMHVRTSDVNKLRRLETGTVMFPSAHDITPEVLGPCLTVLRRLLAAGNQVLVVSKPHLECIEAICRDMRLFRDQILFRFTIGARSESILAYWEPGAPSYEERLASLRMAHKLGYRTSVSCEPLLDAGDAVGLFRDLKTFVSDSIWIGKMNRIAAQVVKSTNRKEIARIERGQDIESVRSIYAALKNEPLAKWKESYKQALGLDMPEMIGLDV